VYVFPALRYRDAPAAIDWLERVLGFETTERIDNPDGTIAHAELRLGDGLVMLGSGPADLQDPPENARADVSELFEQDYGSRDFNARDLEGNHWSFGTYVPPHAAAARPDSA